MDAIDQEMVRAIGENKQGTFTPETIEKLRKLQAKSLDARWEAKLEGLRRRAPFKDYPVLERNRALQRAATLAPGLLLASSPESRCARFSGLHTLVEHAR